MIRGGFLSGEVRARLEAVARHPSEEHGVARRADALLLLDDGMSGEQVARVPHLDDDTVRGWYERFRTEGHGRFVGLRLEGRREQTHAAARVWRRKRPSSPVMRSCSTVSRPTGSSISPTGPGAATARSSASLPVSSVLRDCPRIAKKA